ncbi:MAG: tetratricopeptide repeat protein [Candidatus Obscuribacterales bacterium]|nr:tetratricopeptide repeat protein [Candidatus Obscuribacterales bacterium]
MLVNESLGRKPIKSIAIVVTCWLSVMANSASAQKSAPTDAVSAASHSDVNKDSSSTGTKNGAVAGDTGSSGADSQSSSSSDHDSTGSAASSAGSDQSSSVESATDDGATGAKITATEVSVTPLDKSGEEQSQEVYATNDKARTKLLQQHEAVQHFHASQSYAKEWDYELAELEIRAAIMYMPEMKIAHRDYCLIAIMRCQPLRALAEFFMVVGLADPIPLTEDQQKELRTQASQAHYKKGLAKATDGKWDDAITELLWARTYLPNDPAIHRSLGFAYASKGDFKMAEQYYRSSIEIDPSNAFARADFAFLLAKKGKRDQAVAEMAEAVKADPDSTALHVDLGWLAEAQGDLATAEEEFRSAVERSPQYTALWMHLGQILEKQNKIDAARDAYSKAFEAERSSKEAQAALARLSKTASPAQTTQPSVGKTDGAVTPLVGDGVARTETPVGGPVSPQVEKQEGISAAPKEQTSQPVAQP